MAVRKLARICIAAIAVGVVTIGCDASGTSSPPSPTNEWLLDYRITYAMELREQLGLRSDASWVRTVAAMTGTSASIDAFGLPLAPEEFRVLQDRTANTDAVAATVQAYGDSHPEDWVSVYVEPTTGVVVALFTHRVPEHAAALRGALGPGALLRVEEARWSRADLEELFRRISADMVPGDFFVANQMYPLGAGVDEARNQVFVDVSSARKDVDGFLEEHYGAWGMIAVTSDGTGARLMPTGTLRGQVIDKFGVPVSGVAIELDADIAGAGPLHEFGHATDSDGRFEIPEVTAVGYDVLVYTDEEVGLRELLATSRAQVKADEVTQVTIVLTE